MRSMGDSHQSWQKGLSLKLVLLQLHKFPKNSTSTILQLFLIWSKLERWKSKWVPHGLTENQKNLSLWSVVVLFLYNKLFLDQIVIWDKKWILYENWRQPAKGSEREETPKNFPKQMCTKKKSWSLVFCCWSGHYSFLNPSESISSEKYAQQIEEMQVQHWQPALVNREGPISMHGNAWLHVAQPMLQKLNQLGHKVVFYIYTCHIHLTTNWLPLLQASWQLLKGKTLPQPGGGRKCFPRVHQILKCGFLCYRNKKPYFSLARCVDCNVSYFD